MMYCSCGDQYGNCFCEDNPFINHSSKEKLVIKAISPSHCVLHNLDQTKVTTYSTLMDLGSEFPPIKVISKDGLYYVVDGNHRAAAALALGRLLLANVIEYEDASVEELTLVGLRFGKGG